MIEGLKERKYLQSRRKRMAPISFVLSVALFTVVIVATAGVNKAQSLLDIRSLLVVLGGTLASILFQFDMATIGSSVSILLKSLLGTPDKDIRSQMNELDDAVLRGVSLSELRKPDGLNGELLNDVVYMQSQGLLFDEIDQFITARIKDFYFDRETAVSILQKASIVAPSFGLFGTVIGLVHVMQSMNNPNQIGPAMSLALMTTAYGAGLASVVFTPLAGRLEYHNAIYLEVHKQLLSKIGVLLKRDERSFDHIHAGVGA
jgi:chemotaxis protein MotA